MIERWASSDGLAIRYLDNGGDGPGSPVVFVPGITDTADEYADTLAAFVPRRALVLELRGRGRSDAPTTGYRSDLLAGDVLTVLEHAGIDRYHLMTFSRGTTAGLLAMLQAPERVLSVSIGDYFAGEVALGPDMADYMMNTRFRGRPMSERLAPHVIPAIFAESRQQDLHEALGATGIPVLLAMGTEEGRLVDDERLAVYQRHVRDLRVVVMQGAGHDLFRLDRTAFARAVSTRLDELGT